MKRFNTNKVNTEYRDNVTYESPIKDRKYTVTHSDTTGELFVTIGLEYATDKINSMRDEVLIELIKIGTNTFFYGEVLVTGDGIKGNAKTRNDIFIKEMPTALKAIRYGDRDFFEEYPELDDKHIYIQFKSINPKYDKLRGFGTMKMYKLGIN